MTHFLMLQAAWLSYSPILIEGPDAGKYLQGQLTCDVLNLSEQTAQLTAHCNAQGRMVSLGYLIKNKQAEKYLYLIPKDISEFALKNLKKFVLRSKVQIKLMTPDTQVIGLWGNLDLLEDLKDLKKINLFKLDSQRALVLLDPENQELGCNKLRPYEAWLENQIENKSAWLTPETLEKFLPDEIKLASQNGVCLTKGCFIGQEIIARMHYLGHSKNNLSHKSSDDLMLKPLDSFITENFSGKIICQVILNQKNHCLFLSKTSQEKPT